MTPHSKRTPDDLDAWRQAYRQSAPAVDAGADCPADENLAALVVDGLEDEPESRVRVELADHVVDCDHCRERWRLLRDLHREAGGPIGSRTAPRRRFRWTLAAAAVVVLATALAWLAPLRDGPTDSTVLRSEDGADASRNEDIVEPAPDATLTGAPRRLTWQPDAGHRDEVLVRLLDAEGRVLWRQRGPDGVAELPEEVGSKLEPGGSYLWVVDRTTGRLGPYWFTLGP